MRTPRARRPVRGGVRSGVLVGVLLGALALGGCAGGGPLPDTSQPPPPTPAPTVSVPSDGVSLSALGFENGPVDRVFVPVGAQVSSRVDQPNDVAVVLTSPSASELAAFYRRTSVANGFTLTADDGRTATLTFSGFGWTGTFTGDRQASALLLRPAS